MLYTDLSVLDSAVERHGVPSGLSSKLWSNRLVRFTTGGCFNLLNRLCWAFLFSLAGLPIWLNYGLVHLITLIFGYTYHTLVTFRQKTGLVSFRKFVLSVIGLRVVDYCLVVATNHLESIRARMYGLPGIGSFVGDNLFYISIFTVSAIMFVIRYTVFRKITFAKVSEQGNDGKMVPGTQDSRKDQ